MLESGIHVCVERRIVKAFRSLSIAAKSLALMYAWSLSQAGGQRQIIISPANATISLSPRREYPERFDNGTSAQKVKQCDK